MWWALNDILQMMAFIVYTCPLNHHYSMWWQHVGTLLGLVLIYRSTQTQSNRLVMCCSLAVSSSKDFRQQFCQSYPVGLYSDPQMGKPHLSLLLICSALANILALMSPMPFPLMSTRVSEVLLPSAFSTMVRSVFSLESARDRDVSGCKTHNSS